MTRRKWVVAILGVASCAAMVVLACGDKADRDVTDAGQTILPDSASTVDSGSPLDDASVLEDAAPDATNTEGCASGAEVTAMDIADNHLSDRTHFFTIPGEDIAAGVEKTYDIQGEGHHPHSIFLTAQEFQTLAAGGSVQVTSTIAGGHEDHSHLVTIECN